MHEPRLLRPLGNLDLLNEAFDLLKRSFRLLVGIGAVVYLPAALFVPYALYFDLLERMPLVGGLICAVLLLMLLAANGAMQKALADVYLGSPVSAAGAWAYVLRRLMSCLLTSALAVGLGLLRRGWIGLILLAVMSRTVEPSVGPAVALVVGLLWLGFISLFWFHGLWSVMLVEGSRYRAAVRRNREIVAGNRRRMAVLALYLFPLYAGAVILLLVLLGSLQGLMAWIDPGSWLAATWDPHTEDAVYSGLMQAAWLAILPVLLILSLLLYVDTRVRREGLDLVLLLHEGGELPPVVPPAATPPATPSRPAQPGLWDAAFRSDWNPLKDD